MRKSCKAYDLGIQVTIPQQVKKNIKRIDAVIALIEKDKKFFIQKRPSKGLLADLWEFPGGKKEKGETSKKALAREIEEELGVKLKSAVHYLKTHHFYTEYKVHLDVWRSELESYPKMGKMAAMGFIKAVFEVSFCIGFC